MPSSRLRLRPLAAAALQGALLAATAPPLPAQDLARNLLLEPAARPAAAQEQRVALVIGNNAYRDAPLINPVNDARAMAAALEVLGFKVTLRTDIGHRDFLVALREFGDALRRSSAGLFYYAGHGMQIKGRNYLIPVGAPIEREDEVAYGAVDAQAVLDKMEAAGNATNLMILDACRNNPFARSFRSAVQGLAQMEAPVGTLVAFATAPGAVASDGGGVNGLYTRHLLQALGKPGLKAEDVFKQTRAAVRRDSQGKQIPWESTSMEGDFYFVAAPAAAAPPAPPPAPVDTARAVEEAFWASVKDSRDAALLRAYVTRYPQGQHLSQARALLAQLAPPPPPAAATTSIAAPTPGTSVAPPAAAAPAIGAGARDDANRAEHARVTAALLGEVRLPPPPAADATPAQAQALPARVPPQQPALGPANPYGYTVGDKWNYQTVDRWIGEVVRNFSIQVKAIDTDGGWVSTGGERYDAAGRLRRSTVDNDNVSEFNPHAPGHWPGMKIGDTLAHAYEVRTTSPTGAAWVDRVSSRARVLRREKVQVPAGSFEALRVEIQGDVTAVGRYGTGHFTLTVWYVPELHTTVAGEKESTWNGKLDVRTRTELTSLRLVRHPDLEAQLPAELRPDAAGDKRRNAQGFMVGEQWRYRRIDQWKGTAAGERLVEVERFDDQGAVVFRDDAGYIDSWYRFARGLLAPAQPAQPILPGRTVWWEDMRPGDQRKLVLDAKQRNVFGAVAPAVVRVTLTHKGAEKVRVPAGEYEALRLEADGSSEWPYTSAPMFVPWTMQLWYVPALRAFAAIELTSRRDRERLELVQFDLRSGPLAAR